MYLLGINFFFVLFLSIRKFLGHSVKTKLESSCETKFREFSVLLNMNERMIQSE